MEQVSNAFLTPRKMCSIMAECDSARVTYRLQQQHFLLFSVEITKKSERLSII